MKTIEEIYLELLQAFSDQAGFVPEESCDLSVRLHAVAAQVQSLLIQADWVAGWHEATVRARLNRYLGNPVFESGTDPVLEETASQLDDYFAGKRKSFDLPLRFLGTEFQTAVWDSLRKIPFGRVTTYGEIAEAIGKPKAMRAVGIAVGENPFSIIVPCHRVVGRDGSLTGYGGGFDAKRYLLNLEGIRLPSAVQQEFRF